MKIMQREGEKLGISVRGLFTGVVGKLWGLAWATV